MSALLLLLTRLMYSLNSLLLFEAPFSCLWSLITLLESPFAGYLSEVRSVIY
jgi:hypothetical protein